MARFVGRVADARVMLADRVDANAGVTCDAGGIDPAFITLRVSARIHRHDH